MRKTGKLRLGAVVAVSLAAATAGSGCGVLEGEPERDVVVIGVDLALTGAGSDAGGVFRQAIELRVEQINEASLLRGRDLELLVLDNRSDPATSVTNLLSLATDPSVTAIVTGGCSACVVEATETFDQEGVPVISLALANEVVEPVAERQHVFKLGPNARDNAALLTGALSAAEVAAVGLVVTDDTYGQDGEQALAEATDRAEIDVVATETVTSDTDRIAAAAAAIAAYQPEPDAAAGQVGGGQVQADAPPGPDAVVVWAPAPITSEFAVALRGTGYEGELFLDAVAADDVLLVGQAGSALSGATMVFTETLVIDDVIATSPAKVARQGWVRDYTARFGGYDASSSFAADAVELVVQALNAIDSAETDRSVLRDSIEVMQMEGFSGTLQMSPRQHSGLRPQALTTLVARGDRWRPSA